MQLCAFFHGTRTLQNQDHILVLAGVMFNRSLLFLLPFILGLLKAYPLRMAASNKFLRQ